jgi:hypothetical protein
MNRFRPNLIGSLALIALVIWCSAIAPGLAHNCNQDQFPGQRRGGGSHKIEKNIYPL